MIHFKSIRRAGLALAIGLATLTGLAEARPLTARDLAMLDRVSDPQISPDGRWLTYVLRETDWAGNRGVTSIWKMDRLTPAMPPRRLAISEKPASSPRWSADGKTLYFLSSRSGTNQVWRTDADGATAVQVTDLPLNVRAFRVSPDGRTLVAAIDVVPDCDTLKCTKDRQDARKANQVSAAIYDRLPLFTWDDWQLAERSQLFALRLDAQGAASSEPVRLMKDFDSEAPEKPFGDDADFAIAGNQVIFSALEPGAARGVDDRQQLWAVPLDGSAPPRKISPAQPGAYARPTLSPDGTKLAFLGRKGHGGGDRRAGIYVRDLRSGAVRELTAAFDRSFDTLRWSPNGRTIYATAGDTGRVRLFAVDAASGKVSRLTEEGQVSGLAVAGGRVVYALDSMGGPAQLYEAVDGPDRQLTRHNAEKLAGVDLSPYEQFTFKGWNDETVHAYVMPPAGAEPGRKYPVAFLIHGGPHGSFGDAWSYRWNPQVWAGMGYAVVMVDFHGSSGYGEAFAESIVGHWGDRPLEDLQKGWAAALARYPYLDGERACVLGGSYGGYMVSWIAGNWKEPWKCLVNHAGIVENRMMALTTDIPGFSEYETDGLAWEAGPNYERFNPINHVGKWEKPMLVIHGGRDLRVPLSQGIAIFTAAQRKGVPSKFVYFPDENHWVLKPQNSVEWYRNVEEWMRRWIGPEPNR